MGVCRSLSEHYVSRLFSHLAEMDGLVAGRSYHLEYTECSDLPKGPVALTEDLQDLCPLPCRDWG